MAGRKRASSGSGRARKRRAQEEESCESSSSSSASGSSSAGSDGASDDGGGGSGSDVPMLVKRFGKRSKTEQKQLDAIPANEQEEMISALVRYCLFRHSANQTINHADIKREVFSHLTVKSAASIFLPLASERLEKLFGLEVARLPDALDVQPRGGVAASSKSKAKRYILRNVMQAKGYVLDSIVDKDPEAGLLALVLTIVELEKGAVLEPVLFHHLESCGLMKSRSNGGFGNVKKLVSKTFVQRLYLQRSKVGDRNDPSIEYRWGPRAKAELGAEVGASYKKGGPDTDALRAERNRLARLRIYRLINEVTGIEVDELTLQDAGLATNTAADA